MASTVITFKIVHFPTLQANIVSKYATRIVESYSRITAPQWLTTFSLDFDYVKA